MLLRPPNGFSITSVLLVLGISAGSMSYIITNLLPKLQTEKEKASKTISYQIFMSSLSEYMIHSLRDRWCLEVDSNGETNLLQSSNHCLKDSPMEDVVTYKGNLERLLWDDTTIGANEIDPKNTILAVNKSRRDQGKTTIVLDKSKVEVPQNEMIFTVSNLTLLNMTTNHPLYVMSQGVKNCLDSVKITLALVKDANNQPKGEEKKVSIKIQPQVSVLKGITKSCRVVKDIQSTTFYTLYPRRLHTFSLIKYGNLDASLAHEYNGPVYVSGHVSLPPESADPENTSVFKNKLTLGVFNGGTSNEYWAGKIVERDQVTEHTSFLRAHPLQSKQNSYAGFRGFLGGVSFDSLEDKGFYNLFDSSSQDTQSQEKLRLCIDETKYVTDKSMNSNSKFGYKLVPDLAGTAIHLGLSHRNRFAPSSSTIVPPKDTTSSDTASNQVYPLAFQVNEGGAAVGEISISYKYKDYSKPQDVKQILNTDIISKLSSEDAVLGSNGTKFRLKINGTFFTNQLNEALVALKKRFNYDLFPTSSHPLYQLAEYISYKQKAELYEIASKSSSERAGSKNNENDNTDNGKDSPNGNDSSCPPESEKETLKKDYEESLLELKTTLEKYKVFFQKLNIANGQKVYTDAAEMIFTINNIRNTLSNSEKTLYKDNLVLNQLKMIAQRSTNWDFIFKDPNLKKYANYEVDQIVLKLRLYDYSTIDRILQLKLNSTDFTSFSHVDVTNNHQSTPSSEWASASDNSLLDQTKDSEKITSIYTLDCPEGMGLADWDLDMSQSSNFAWNFANTPPGVDIQREQNKNAPFIKFSKAPSVLEYPTEGSPRSYTKSVVDDCVVESDRDNIYGFYVCKNLIIKPSTNPLTITGTFIVSNIDNQGRKVYWYSVWDPTSANRILRDFYSLNDICKNLASGNIKLSDVITSKSMRNNIDGCSALNLVLNGPNNFSWTSVDPEIGLATPSDVMTSQKINRVMKWVTQEETKTEWIR